jgi:hypothetical protein
MAYAGDLKSPDAYASCGFDPHPGHQFGGVTANRSFSSAAPAEVRSRNFSIETLLGENRKRPI